MVFRPAFAAAFREVRVNRYHSVDSNQVGSTLLTPSSERARGKYVWYISPASTVGNCSLKYDRSGVTAMPPLTREPPPTPRPTYTDMWSKCTRSRTPGYALMSLLTRSSHRKVASGASVRVRNHMERWSGAAVEQKTLPSVPGVFHSRPISRTRVRMPAWPRRRAATAPP